MCDEIIDQVCERGECDFVWDIAAQLPLIMIGDALGFDPEDRAELLRWSDDMLRGLTGTDDDDAMIAAAQAFERLHRVRRTGGRRPPGLPARRPHEHPRARRGRRRPARPTTRSSTSRCSSSSAATRRPATSSAAAPVPAPHRARRSGSRCVADPPASATAVEEMLRWVTPIKNMARTVTRDRRVPRRSSSTRATSCCCSTRRPTATRPSSTTRSRFDIARAPERPRGVRLRRPLLPGQLARAARAAS